MNFLPTADQLELQRGVRDLLDDAFPLEKLPNGYDAALWQQLTETGVFSLRTELGLGMAEAVLVFEELGRAAVPGPLVATFLTAGQTTGPVGLMETEPQPMLVAHLDRATAVLVLSADLAWLAEPPTGKAVAEPIDPLTPLFEIAAPPEFTTALDDAERLRLEGAVLTAALQTGIAARLTELAVDYAKQREQFGRTIGSFQAIKHICADMLVRTELARVATHSAAVMLDDPDAGDAARAGAGAKLLADEAATTNGRAAVQVHGGMGFTWEVPVHYFLKRAWFHATELGTADDHAEDVAALL